jgi:hypothetical protein
MITRTLMTFPLLAMLATGCSPDFEARIAGAVDGLSVTPVTAYWGGPFIVFTGDDLDCEDFSFISKFNEDGDEPLVDFDIRLLQISYNDSDVVAGSYDFSGESPVIAEVIDISGGAMSVYRATEGSLVVEGAEGEDLASGEFAISFEENDEDLGALTGDFTLPWCTNLKSRF